MKVVINRCYGGFGLSHKAVMEYAKIKGFKLYPFVETRNASGKLNFHKHRPYKEGEDVFLIHYSRKPLTKKGTFDDNSYFSDNEIERNDPALIQVVEKLGKEADGHCAKLGIIEIPDNVNWHVEEYDGIEHIAEDHETWS